MKVEKTIYASMGAVTKVIGIDPKGIREKSLTGKLYKRRYSFKLL